MKFLATLAILGAVQAINLSAGNLAEVNTEVDVDADAAAEVDAEAGAEAGTEADSQYGCGMFGGYGGYGRYGGYGYDGRNMYDDPWDRRHR